MKTMIRNSAFTFVLILLLFSGSSQILTAVSLSEKRANLQGFESGKKEKASDTKVRLINEDLTSKREALIQLHTEANQKYLDYIKQKKSSEEIEALLQTEKSRIQKAKEEISALERQWKTMSKEMSQQEVEGLWHQPDTTIGQLVIDYGSSDWIYLMPPEIASFKLHISSQLSVPRASWSEMMELIFQSNGIGMKDLNPFMRQLYFMRLNPSGLSSIIDSEEELALYLPTQRVCYVLSPPPTELKRVYQFLEKFVPQEIMTFQMLASNIVIVGSTKEISELLKIYAFLITPKQTQEYRIISLQRAQSDEIAKIIQAIFDSEFSKSEAGGEARPMSFSSQESTPGFRIIALKKPSQSLFLWGKRDVLEKAAQIIQDIESKIGEVQEKTIFWYGCKNSDATDLAKVLSQVYTQMVALAPELGAGAHGPGSKRSTPKDSSTPEAKPQSNPNILSSSDYLTPPAVEPTWDSSSKTGKKQSGEVSENFIVDVKTNSIVMVVESYLLDKIKELARTLDVPKRMVQIDVLLCEKKVNDKNTFGINLLRLSDAASGKHKNGLSWSSFAQRRNESRRSAHHSSKHNKKESKKEKGKENDRDSDLANDDSNNPSDSTPLDIPGILQYAISRGHNGAFVPFDLSFDFLLNQNDVQINANPSVTAVNQTPTKISVVEEISISTGVTQLDDNGATHLKDSFQRSQYGVIITITPTIHAEVDSEVSEGKKYITLNNDVVFDTIVYNGSSEKTPNIIKRSIKNEVRIADGETIILGGLRRKNSASSKNSIPFLGELPGIGKFFSHSELTDDKIEMFIFITPRIIPDATEAANALRQRDLEKRPGDIPEFLHEIELAKKKEHSMLFEQSIKALFQKDADAFNLRSK